MSSDPERMDFATAVPKAEIHLHLEGSIDLETLILLRRARGESVGPEMRRRLAARYVHRDFMHFLQNYGAICAEIRRVDDFDLITTTLCSHLARNNVRYAEVMCSPTVFTRAGMPVDEIMDVVAGAARRAEEEGGPRLRFLFDGVRQWGVGDMEELVLMGRDCQRYGVIGIGIGGDESAEPTAAFAEAFREARRLGLRTVAHAGEFEGPRSIWEAIDILEVERVGHGIRAVEDAELVEALARRGIPLECCPTSNVSTGIVGAWEEHPLKVLHAAGVVVTVSSDDPALFATSTAGEWRALEERIGLGRRDVLRIGLRTVEATFADRVDKDRLASAMTEAAGRFGVEA